MPNKDNTGWNDTLWLFILESFLVWYQFALRVFTISSFYEYKCLSRQSVPCVAQRSLSWQCDTKTWLIEAEKSNLFSRNSASEPRIRNDCWFWLMMPTHLFAQPCKQTCKHQYRQPIFETLTRFLRIRFRWWSIGACFCSH